MGLHASGGRLYGTTSEKVLKAFIKVNKKQGSYQGGVKVGDILEKGTSFRIQVRADGERFTVSIKQKKIRPYQEGNVVIGKEMIEVYITNSKQFEFFQYEEWVDMVKYSGALFGEAEQE